MPVSWERLDVGLGLGGLLGQDDGVDALHPELVDAILSFMEPVGSKNDPLRFRRDSDKFSSVSDGKFDKDKGIIQDLDVLSNQLQCLENLCR